MTSDINEDLSPRVKAAAICGVILSSLFFAGRVASRRIKKQRLDSSDYTLMIGMICGWGIYALMFWGKPTECRSQDLNRNSNQH